MCMFTAQSLALAVRRAREQGEESDAKGIAGGPPEPSTSSSSTEHKKVDVIDTGHLVLYIILSVLVCLFAPALLLVFWTEVRDRCRRLLVFRKRGRGMKKKKKNNNNNGPALHPLTMPLEITQQNAQQQQLSNTAGFPSQFQSQSHGCGNAAQGEETQGKRDRAHSI